VKTVCILTFLGLFALLVALPRAAQAEDAVRKGNGGYFTIRRSLNNARIAFESGSARVVFLGGSITHMKGWRAMISKDLQARFPNTTFDFVDAGIPSTGKKNEENPMDVQFLIVDECSMLDITLTASLLKAVPPIATSISS